MSVPQMVQFILNFIAPLLLVKLGLSNWKSAELLFIPSGTDHVRGDTQITFRVVCGGGEQYIPPILLPQYCTK